ncbi:MAG: DegT/DnrJ/EryC1/StrS family aminotransferase [Candidatus Omnitrophica bacterium]|nr:DegT/DnrJ/EryC1/StrS family aminotransferase [Candidatus Omnitrophota bacterium]
MKINFIDLQRQYQLYKDEIDAQIEKVISSAAFIMGPQVKELEEQLSDFLGVKHTISCSSGTDALSLALMAYDIRPGDEIITTTFTFIATAEVISLLKAKPVFVDIKEDTFNIDPDKIETAITPKTKGIIAVDIFGQCADYDEIKRIAKKHNLFVIEDGAQSFGAEYKGRKACSLADVGCTSFFPAKPLGCFGDGGAVFTNNDELAEIMKSIRIHGKGQNKYDNVRVGLNARIDTIQAAILLAKLPHYEKEVGLRNEVACRYKEGLSDVVITPKIYEHNLSVFAQYSIRTEQRPDLQNALKEKGIPTAIHYPKPLHLQPAFAALGYTEGSFPMAESVCGNILALPMHPYLKREEQDTIIETIKSFYQS